MENKSKPNHQGAQHVRTLESSRCCGTHASQDSCCCGSGPILMSLEAAKSHLTISVEFGGVWRVTCFDRNSHMNTRVLEGKEMLRNDGKCEQKKTIRKLMARVQRLPAKSQSEKTNWKGRKTLEPSNIEHLPPHFFPSMLRTHDSLV